MRRARAWWYTDGDWDETPEGLSGNNDSIKLAHFEPQSNVFTSALWNFFSGMRRSLYRVLGLTRLIGVSPGANTIFCASTFS